jgi:GT2 family glycosyltransferase
MNYICHLFVVKRSLMERVGVLQSAYDGAQDYDFILRCTEEAERICHIPKVLYHWRCHLGSTADNPESKRYAFEAGKRAVQAHYDRLGIPATVESGPFYGLYKTTYHWQEEPLVSIIIPNKDHIEDLKKCMDSIDGKSTYRNYEFIIVENNSTKEETFAFYQELEQRENVRVLYYPDAFNYSKINNFGAQAAQGEYLLLLNNDTEIINPDCIAELLGFCMREDVGIVGARLYYPDDTIQHAGVVLGFGGIAGHAFVGSSRYDNGYFSRIICAQDYSAVTAACMMTKKSVYEQVGGLTEEFCVAFNDIDYCLKVRKAGKLVVYDPAAELYHYESKSRGLEDTPEKIERFNSEAERLTRRWKDEIEQGDMYYNPNLSLDKADFSLKE